MKYLLGKDVIAKFPVVEITEAEYAAYRAARNALLNAFAIEEKYEILISNYLDFEKQIVEAMAASMVRNYLDYSDFFSLRLGFNIRLVNILTSARLYCDQIEQHVRECLPDLAPDETKARVRALFSAEYDKYRE